ncbi:MAG: uroporphyrinogen-III C-methyltransferase [Proteobacteria bacterium]|nr:uroporphyrinogen-III C-methyltransferase [Pseudomonadota bacterium]
MAGKVYLVGAGPGDPELLTLKAVRALGEADVVVVDDLVNPEVLAHAPGARIVHAGKRGGCKSTPQAFIEKLMVRCAKRGLTVARLKGGDPFVFGRGGEELLTLAAAGIEVEVVSGITAGMGATAALGIPVTHRDIARGVTFITGHTRDGAEPDWQALVRSGTTLVVYMGVANLPRIAGSLLVAGMPASMPAAAIQHGTTPLQKQVISTLAQLQSAVADAGIGSPALLVFGAVVALAGAEALDRTERRAA